MKTIAVIDDDKDFLFLVQTLLKKEGYKVLAYSDAVSFSKAFEEGSIDIDMIVTDVQMPFKSGIELIYDLCMKCSTIKQIPVIFLTGKVDDITINNAFENNVVFIHYLIKPLNFTLLLMTIHKMFLLKDQYIAIKDANDGLLSVIRQVREQQMDVEKNMEVQKKVYESEQDRLYKYLKELRLLIQK